MGFLRRYPEARKMRLIGPNCAGNISPGKGFMEILPPDICMAGRVAAPGGPTRSSARRATSRATGAVAGLDLGPRLAYLPPLMP